MAVPNLGPQYAAYSGVCIVIVTAFSALRFWSRLFTKGLRRWWWDDALTGLSWIIIITYLAINIAWTYHGAGRPFSSLSPDMARDVLKYFVVDEFFWSASLTAPKLVALCFYERVFESRHYVKLAVRIGHCLVLSYFIQSVLFLGLQCLPLHKFWDVSAEGTCANNIAWFTFAAIYDAVIDLYILILPLPVLHGLQITRDKKLLLMGVFIVGYMSPILSFARLGFLLANTAGVLADISYTGMPNWYLTMSEPVFCLVGVCLPSTFHLYRQSKKHGFSSLFTLNQTSEDPLVVRKPVQNGNNITGSDDSQNKQRHLRFGNPFGGKNSSVSARGGSYQPSGANDAELSDGIKVQTTVSVV